MLKTSYNVDDDGRIYQIKNDSYFSLSMVGGTERDPIPMLSDYPSNFSVWPPDQRINPSREDIIFILF